MDNPRRQIVIRAIQALYLAAAQMLHLLVLAATLYDTPAYWAQPYHTSKLSGQAWVDELINGHPDRIYSQLGVRLHVFVRLLYELRRNGYDSTDRVQLEEQLAIYLYSCVTGLSCRHVAERFQRANETVSRYFRRMNEFFSDPAFYNKYVQLPSLDDPEPPIIRNNPKFWPFLKGCLGALDGSHIVCSPSAEDRGNMRNRKGFLSQNILAACNFLFRFVYVLPGWDGSVSDSFLFGNARLHSLPIPAGHFYLGDAGFPLCSTLLVPYRGVRYHLQEWAAVPGLRPTTKEELFNLRHASARNVIERIFGVIKKRWQILVVPPHYSMSVQARIPAALAALHNFIMEHDLMDDTDAAAVENTDADADPSPGLRDPHQPQHGQLAATRITEEETEAGKALREKIADAMWADYCRVRAARAAEGEYGEDGMEE